MERLTKRIDGIDVLESWAIDKDPVSIIQRLCNRLAAYEDTGLDPEDVRRLQGDWTSLIMTLDEMGGMPHLHDLLQAEQDGRLVVLPCKVGDTVYRVLTTRDCPPVISEVKIKTVGQAADLIGRMGKRKLLSHYLTREEAEAALDGKGGDG